MNKKELLKLIESIDDEGSVDEVLSESDFAKSLLQSGLTLNAFKEKLKEPDFKSYLDSVKDKHFDKALETWKSNNLQTIINDEVLKATGKKKTPEQLKIEELEKNFNEQKAKAERAEKIAKYKDVLAEKKIPGEMIDYFLTDDDETTNTRIDNFATYVEGMVSSSVKEKIASGSYTPPGENGAGDLTVDDLAKMMM
ncbi:MAG: DUF4355 domain-containing protein [Clostridium sp.]|nr:DUF4355 domain-containing protein [Clostridium sp.]MDU7085648.1 DUF4355 domain-containing protein [Clostridium sp.]